ncbi:GM18408 [Drosophila sechellia]|uniref:GM18408 n=1 Tax=Drosophila sechellia TaxID=7238 RepID=B4I2Y1_DROSE|nr:GM18408 [Drosophila sechellia]
MATFFENSLLQHKTRYQLLATVIVNIITFGHGVGVGWLSPTLTKIQTLDSPLDFEVNLAEISWLGSMLGLGSLCGNLTIALLIERAGRKFGLYLMAGPYACIWILIYCASNVYYLYAARFLCGFTGGAGYLVVPIFISEVATNIMLPETATYLLKKSQLAAAENSFRYYRNQRSAICEQASKVNFEELRTAVLSQHTRNATPLSYKDLTTKPALKGFAASIVSLGYQFSGVFSFINYTNYIPLPHCSDQARSERICGLHCPQLGLPVQWGFQLHHSMSDIFKASGSVVDVNTATIIIRLVQIVGVYTSTILVDIVF